MCEPCCCGRCTRGRYSWTPYSILAATGHGQWIVNSIKSVVHPQYSPRCVSVVARNPVTANSLMYSTTTVVTSETELQERIADLKTAARGELILFRGQTELYPTVRSGRARPDTNVPADVERGWEALVGRTMLEDEASDIAPSALQGMLQHYGLPTYYLDCTHDVRVAAWFAVNAYTELRPMLWIGTALRRIDLVTYKPVPDGLGYVLVFRVPNPESLVKREQLVDLTVSNTFLRPTRQSAALLMDRAPLLPDPNELLSWVIPIDRVRFESSKTERELFPLPTDDKGYLALLRTPFVQIPTAYYSDPPELKDADKALDKKPDPVRFWQHGMTAMRAVRIVEYVTDDKQMETGINHKWDDFTLYEPMPMRLWKWWHFRLEEIHAGVNVDLADAGKVTIHPDIWEYLQQLSNVPLSWPDLGSDSLLFTFAAIDHDKVIEHGPPYLGIWLVKRGDMIIEQGVTSDPDQMAVTPGHVYTFRAGGIVQHEVANGCTCGNPMYHQNQVEALLRLHALVEERIVALVAHPFKIPAWFVAV